ncbi:hypothetical protein KUTeg_000634 [Tegillarca granosa]|uniref:5'-deoxynucleotidase HDDC2 n=1 Tax=Tegillarca granosa TaxID=220873 RepID=A0ABQ9FY31_TEGGR|nr:hypothetical protein KUTeg_000634 [Tegillarca granosa]
MASNTSKLFEFMSLVGQLKHVKRTGWVLKKVSDPESVADHMYRMAVLAFLVDPKTGLDRDKCIKLALVHDMAESIVGDLTPSDEVHKDEKSRREESSEEAKFVKDLDKFDMILQAHEYEQLDKRPKQLQEFFDGTEGKFQTEQVQGWVKELNNIREKK